MEYLQLFELLFKQKIRYLVCGGLAVNIYGVPRMTADIDLLLDFEEENVKKFEGCVKLLSYLSSLPLNLNSLCDKAFREKMLREKNLIAYSFYSQKSNYMAIDILIEPPLQFKEMWDKREVRNVEKTDVNIVSLEHLIALKQFANRKQDQDDVFLLSKLLK